MEQLSIKQEALSHALRRLNNMIERYYDKKSDLNIDEEDFLAYQDSIVKRFEISFDLLWKYLKEVLSEDYGVEVASPKKVIRESFSQGLFSQDEMNVFIKMCVDRNLTAHTYDEYHSAEVAERVIEYYFLIKPALFRIIDKEQSVG